MVTKPPSARVTELPTGKGKLAREIRHAMLAKATETLGCPVHGNTPNESDPHGLETHKDLIPVILKYIEVTEDLIALEENITRIYVIGETIYFSLTIGGVEDPYVVDKNELENPKKSL